MKIIIYIITGVLSIISKAQNGIEITRIKKDSFLLNGEVKIVRGNMISYSKEDYYNRHKETYEILIHADENKNHFVFYKMDTFALGWLYVDSLSKSILFFDFEFIFFFKNNKLVFKKSTNCFFNILKYPESICGFYNLTYFPEKYIFTFRQNRFLWDRKWILNLNSGRAK